MTAYSRTRGSASAALPGPPVPAALHQLEASWLWHNLAHWHRTAGKIGEPNGTHKQLKHKVYSEKMNDINGPKSASQAYDEGSILFTRSNFTQRKVEAIR
jgi:hypothetical protein